MTDITIADQCEIDKYEDIMINVFYYLFSYNYNLGLFTDDSSVYDMKYLALENQDYKDIANDFEKINKEEFDYFEAEKEYNKILNNFFINKITNVFKEKYNYSFTKEKHLLKTIGKELKNLHPNKAWKEENIFLIKRLNHQQKQLKLLLITILLLKLLMKSLLVVDLWITINLNSILLLLKITLLKVKV